MKKFYGATFVTPSELEESNIHHPMKLEYYKICQDKKKECIKYGIEIVKKIYKDTKIETEQEKVLSITTIENKIEEILELLKNHQVTPIILKDVIEDLKYQT